MSVSEMYDSTALAQLHNTSVALREERQLREDEGRRRHYQWHRSMDAIRSRLAEAQCANESLLADLLAAAKFGSATVSPKEIAIRVAHGRALLTAIEEQVGTECRRHGNGVPDETADR